MKKTITVFYFFSMVLFAITLLGVYAYLPMNVELNIRWIELIHKQDFFYGMLAFFVTLNVLFKLISSHLHKNRKPLLLVWANVLNVILNVYFVLLIGFIGIINNAQHVAPSAYGYLNFIGPLLLIVWIGGFLFSLLRGKASA